MPNVKCELCETEVDADNVESTNEHEAICSGCFDEMWQCADCDEHYGSTTDYKELRHGKVCIDCYNDGDYHDCESCEALISIGREEYFYDDNNNCYACSDCADESMAECSRCEGEILYSECGSDNYQEGLCYDCHNKRDEHIRNYASSNRVDAAVMKTLECYKALSSDGHEFMNWFYRGNEHDYQKIDREICKGATGTFKHDTEDKPKWWKGKLAITSQVFHYASNIMYTMINSNTFLTEHKKYGLYHPIRDIFRQQISYRDTDGEVIKGADVNRQDLGADYFNYRIEYVNKSAIAGQLEKNETEDGADLRRALNQVFSRAYKNRLPQFINARERSGRTSPAENWNGIIEKYNTNASVDEIDIQIGFDSEFEHFKDIDDFNERVGSCQARCNRDTYAFAYMDMFVNPHLFAFLRNKDGRICGRSVIRVFKEDWSDEEAPVYIAPSRLYLNEHTNSKTDVYVGLFKAIDEWASKTFADHKLVAYRSSRHDASIRSILSNAQSPKLSLDYDQSRRTLSTQKWLPFWHTKPDASDCDFTYYRDEEQRHRFQLVSGGTNAEYAAYEQLHPDDYILVETKND